MIRGNKGKWGGRRGKYRWNVNKIHTPEKEQEIHAMIHFQGIGKVKVTFSQEKCGKVMVKECSLGFLFYCVLWQTTQLPEVTGDQRVGILSITMKKWDLSPF